MLEVVMYIKESGYGTGVTVSANHLCHILAEGGISAEIDVYKDDEDLIARVKENTARLTVLQVPTFSNDTLREIVATGKPILLATHSTICNLQVEGDALSRLLEVLDMGCPNLYVSCPSLVEVNGFRSFAKTKVCYLPNTYSYAIEDERINKKIEARANCFSPIKISIFCAIRAFKNILTQMSAVSLVSKRFPDIELHLLEGNDYLSDCIDQLARALPFPVVRHPSCTNEELLDITSDMHIGMQVSLSETFSYVAHEHMNMGVPVIASASVPYANVIVDYCNAEQMADAIIGIIENSRGYAALAKDTVRRARSLTEEVNRDALALFRELLASIPS